MLKLLVFAVRDAKMEAFLPPFTMLTNALAMRAFMDEVRRPESGFYAHPEDFQLFYLGEFDQSTGSLIPAMQVTSLCSGLEANAIKAVS